MDSEKRKYDHLADGDQDSSPRKRLIGPSMPPSMPPPTEAETQASEDGETDDSDDDFGPGLPPSHGGPAASVQTSDPHEPDYQTNLTTPLAKKESARDDDWASKIDPTQLRNRKFQTGKSARSGAGPKQVDAAWTETPEERMRRLGDEVMGVGKQSTTSGRLPKPDPSQNRSMEEKVKKYNDRMGKNTRLEEQKARKDEDDDPSARGFDREKDMAISSKITGAQRRDMVNRASDYGSRFSKGNFL
ncbi:hypothetical protein N7470_007361 [Penicillium chermesinum]|nr:hypothetical protein N7470_007361 [Penicillium chermesinum]